VLVAEAVSPDALDAAELRERLTGVQQELAEAGEGTAAQEAAERETRRLEAFLQIAENT
jgi:F0F1-type ATP synthase epsilon subunit